MKRNPQAQPGTGSNSTPPLSRRERQRAKFIVSAAGQRYDAHRISKSEISGNVSTRTLAALCFSGAHAYNRREEGANHMDFVSIPSGSFMMGCSAGDGECYPDEKPLHQVTITRPFELGKFQVTQAQYEAITSANPSYTQNPDLPVDGVSWEDAQKFCEALNSKKDRYHYRLPTEAEWEYAARAGDNSCRYGPLVDVAWFHDNSEGATHPVGQKKPNKFGLYDTLGNVWEWVQDWFGMTYYSQSAEFDPKGPANGEFRVSRGGSWRGVVKGHARVTSRYILKPKVRSIVVGFRCARERLP